MLLRDIPNRATPELAVAFFFPYMSPRDPKCGAVAQKWMPGLNVLDMPPVGPSPALMHVDRFAQTCSQALVRQLTARPGFTVG